ncbi:MAG: ATP-grasp domain-containing protein [Pyrinomonadaceae bacterium]
MNANVLITGAGGAAAISFLSSVRSSLPFEYFMGDIDPYAAGLYLVQASNRIILPRAADADFVDKLLSICERFEIDVLVPTVDMELLQIADAIKRFEEKGTKILLADLLTLRICLDKNELLKHCSGMNCSPKSQVLDEKFDDEGWDYPLFVKPREGAGSRGILKIENACELQAVARDGSMLVQEYLEGEEFSVDVFADKGGIVKAAVPRERLKVDSGVAVASRSIKDEELQNEAIAVATEIGLKYTANIQFKRNSKGEPKLLEVNARFPGTMPLTVKSGVNMPLLSLKELLDLGIDDSEYVWKETAVVRTLQDHFISPGEMAALENEAAGDELKLAA